jgi:hypothetical protein
MKKTACSAVAALLLATIASADSAKDPDAYCAYVTQEANAEKIYLRVPRFESGFYQQPISAGVAQAFVGVSNSLSDDLKSGLVMKAAGTDCELYRATLGLQLRIQYALPAIEKDATRTRLSLIAQAADQLDHMIRDSRRRVTAHNLTVANLYAIQYEKTKLEMQRAQVQLMLATVFVPDVDGASIRDLLVRKRSLEIEKKNADHAVLSQQNWDVAVAVGLHHDISGFTNGSPDGYGGINIKYSFGAIARGHALDRATAAYGEWKESQQSDAIEASGVLRQQIRDSVAVQEATLATFVAENDQIESNIRNLIGLDTDAAVSLTNRLNIDKLTLGIEIGTAQFRLTRLRQFLVDNF